MQLKAVLKSYKCSDSPEKFRGRLIDMLQELFPGYTIDDLVCTPEDATRYCSSIREELDSAFMPDFEILKSLMNVRKRKDCPTGLKSDGTRRYLEKDLVASGCRKTVAEFKSHVVHVLGKKFGLATVDDILCDPKDAVEFAAAVQAKAGFEMIPTEVCLRAIINMRKSGELS